MDDADLDLAVDGILWSAFGTTGQRCTACSRVIVQQGMRRELEERLLERIGELRLGHGLDERPTLARWSTPASWSASTATWRSPAQDGARILCGGEPARGGDWRSGNFYQPTLFSGVTPRMRVAQEEIFGPVLSVIEVETLEEAIAVNNNTRTASPAASSPATSTPRRPRCAT